MEIWIYTLLSVVTVSFLSFVGALSLSLSTVRLKKIILPLVSFSAGALLGDVFIHIIPEIVEGAEFTIQTSLYILLGIFISFFMEKIIAWRHCHLPIEKNHVHTFAYMNLIGDALHNFIDGLIIGASYLVNIPLGISTTVAIALHEIPQEIGDFGVLIHGGFNRRKALFYNSITALTALAGAIGVLLLGNADIVPAHTILPFAAGTFIYIASSDLIPELHKESSLSSGLQQTAMLLLGVGVMALLLLTE